MEIAKTILDQIKATDRAALMAWGAKSFISIGEDSHEGVAILGGVQFSVNGRKIRGKVIVRLTASDTYTVEVGRVRKMEWKSLCFATDVYCDTLMDTIDGFIEN